MSTEAIIMMILALLITWGGAGICIAIAMKRSKK
ncbi:methionine/alanine import family NSS transporter small subunit [Shewanella sp. VB17]|nr:methionine/alanine import family NSS transporter small subunit [Shewanella sp. VB17]NRD75108.1 methionine/alanine import family NSS transporter small subunit [Shewanella sp. VB17]